jgi:hypothetical protein
MTLLTDLGGWPARLLRKIDHESAQARLVRDIRSLTHSTHQQKPQAFVDSLRAGPRIGFATFGSGAWHLGIEILLAHALVARGARPELLLCDMPELPICDERTAFSRDVERCAGCIDDKRELLDGSGVPWQGVRSLVDANALAKARATVDALEDDEIESYCEGQWPIGGWLHVSASHFLRSDARGGSAEKIDTKRRLLATAIVIVHGVERWLDSFRPDIVIAESGAHFLWRIALELARARGIVTSMRSTMMRWRRI